MNVAKKLGTNHNVNSFSIRSFLERTVVERANDYLKSREIGRFFRDF